MIASLNSSSRMVTWLRRLVKDRGGWVDNKSKLLEFSAKTLADGKPTMVFEELISQMSHQSWITWRVGRPKKCAEGHVMELLGTGSYRPDDGWCCQEDTCEAGIVQEGLHLGVKRYRCSVCQTDFCGSCAIAIGAKTSSIVDFSGKVQTSKMPLGGTAIIRAMKDLVQNNEDLVEAVLNIAERILRQVERIRSPNQAVFAHQCYTMCGVAFLALVVIRLLLQTSTGYLLHWLWSLLWITLGSFVIFQRTLPIRRLKTAYFANEDFLRCQQIRARGGYRRWRFFEPDLEPTLVRDVASTSPCDPSYKRSRPASLDSIV